MNTAKKLPNSISGAAYGPGRKGGPRIQPLKADEILKSVFKQYGLDKKISRYKFVLHWKEVVGEEIAKRTKPECIRSGTLVVRVSDSTWAQELSFQKELIIKRLKKFLDHGEEVKDLHFYVTGKL